MREFFEILHPRTGPGRISLFVAWKRSVEEGDGLGREKKEKLKFWWVIFHFVAFEPGRKILIPVTHYF